MRLLLSRYVTHCLRICVIALRHAPRPQTLQIPGKPNEGYDAYLYPMDAFQILRGGLPDPLWC